MPSCASASLSLPQQGDFDFSVVVSSDAACGIAHRRGERGADTMPPAVIVLGPSMSARPFNVTIQVQEPLQSHLTAADVNVRQGSLLAFSGGLDPDTGLPVYIATVTTDRLKLAVQVPAGRVRDLAGNLNGDSNDLVVSVGAPRPVWVVQCCRRRMVLRFCVRLLSWGGIHKDRLPADGLYIGVI
jgi:hypothetical protein